MPPNRRKLDLGNLGARFAGWLSSNSGFAIVGCFTSVAFTFSTLVIRLSPLANRSPLQGYLTKILPLAWSILGLSMVIAVVWVNVWTRRRFKLTQDHIKMVFVSLLVVGVMVRVLHLFLVDISLPYTAGGLFVQFADSISNNSFLLPINIPFYGFHGIPFGYPPLSFYLLALLIGPFNLPPIITINLLPPLLSFLTLPMIYALAGRLGFTRGARLAALAVFTLMPSSFIEFVESAGLAEVSGAIALLGFSISLIEEFNRQRWAVRILAGLLFACCVMASPGSAYAAALMLTIYCGAQLLQQRRVSALIGPLVVGLVGFALSAPYWLTVTLYHGGTLFLSSFSGQHGGGLLQAKSIALQPLWLHFRVSYAEAPFLWDGLILGAFAWGIFTRKWLLPVTFLVLASIPREGRWLMAMPAALLAGQFLDGFLLPHVSQMLRSSYTLRWRKWLTAGIVSILFVYAHYNVVGATQTVIPEYHNKLWTQRLDAMEWMSDNLPAEAAVIALSNEFVAEWVPYVVQRETFNVVQGLEWLPERQAQASALNTAMQRCSELACIYASLNTGLGLAEYWLFIDTSVYDRLVLETGREATEFSFEEEWRNESIVVGRLAGP